MQILVLIVSLVAAPTAMEFDLGRAASARVDLAADGTRLVFDATGDAATITKALVGSEGAKVERISARRVWASVPTKRLFTNVRARGNLVGVQEIAREANVIERPRERTPDFGSLAAIPEFRSADTAIARGKLDEAKGLLAKIASDAPGYAWAQLRLADIAILASDIPNGCVGYITQAGQSFERTASFIAALRAHAFGCANAPVIDWSNVLKRTRGMEGGIGQWMAFELLIDAGASSDRNDIDAVLALTRTPTNWPQQARSLIDDLASRLLARGVAVRMQEPMELASFVRRHTSDLNRHIDGKELRLDAARALINLDLVDDAMATVASLVQRNVPKNDAPIRTWRIVADAYIARGDTDALTRLNTAFEARYHEQLDMPAKAVSNSNHPMLSSLEALEQRLKRVKAHVAGGAQ